ncbi:MAG TPA: hypothetical protein VFE96_06330 [Candidatus Bathyarchaeia archaeon]|nr:hypothetical protein [Candidatus Bathyarchaeia archaeon]
MTIRSQVLALASTAKDLQWRVPIARKSVNVDCSRSDMTDCPSYPASPVEVAACGSNYTLAVIPATATVARG